MGIGAWLASLGLERYAEAFRQAEVTVEILPELSEADLAELGLPLGPRKAVLKAIRALDTESPAESATTPTPPTPARAREAERRQLTVMFVDLVGSTALSRRLDPEDMGQILKAYQNAVVGEISRLDGFTAKLMGDGVLAYFGWPKAQEDEAERAVRAGLAIVAAVAELAAQEPLACRVGIATGLVVVGDLIGEGASQEEAVVGDTPNLAARLQQMAEPGEVVVAEATRQLLGTGFTVESLGPSVLKGIEPTTEAFRVLGERAVESRFVSRSGETVSPMVGRDEELALLLRQWREAVAGEGRAVLVVGEAGIGKSRLIRALREAVLPDRPTVLLYQCSPSHAGSPLWPVMQQLAFAARFEPGDDAATRRAKLAGIVAGAERRDLLASLLGIPGDADPTSGLDPRERRRRTLQALVDELVDLAGKAPVLVLMEDVHWVDPSTIELLQRSLDTIASRPVLVVLTSRPEAEPALGTFPHLSRLVVSRLGRAAVEAMVGRLLEARALDAEVRAQILARTDGVPLFVEELTKAVLEASPAGKGITVPATLQDSLLARLDRDPVMKSVGQISSCIGREFDHALLADIADLATAELSRGLDALVTAELVYRRGTPPDASYAFKHALVRDTAYESLLKSRRRTLHGRIAAALAVRPDPADELLALHFTAAGQIEPALDHWERAGRVAIERSAPREAVAHLGQAIALLDRWADGEDRLVRERRLQAALGGALVTVAGFGAAATRQAFARASALAGEGCEPPTLFPILMGQLFGEMAHDVRALGPIATRMHAVARISDEPSHLLMALRASGPASLWAGEFRAAEQHYRRMLVLYRIEDHRALARSSVFDPSVIALAHLAIAETARGFPARGVRLHADAVAQADRLAHPVSQAFAVHMASIVGVVAHCPAMILRWWEALLSLCERLEMPVFMGFGHAARGWAIGTNGDLEAGIASIERGIAMLEQGEMEHSTGLWFALLADLLSRAGCHSEARHAAERAVGLVERVGDRWTESEVRRIQGEVAGRAGRLGEALPHLEAALAVARAQDAKLFELRASTSLAKLWAEQGERQEAHDLLAPIYAWFTEGFDFPDLVAAKALLGELR